MNFSWEGLYGQKKTKTLLTAIVRSKKIPHAFLFTGIEGIGKDYCALKFYELISSKSFQNNSDEKLIPAKFLSVNVKYIFPLSKSSDSKSKDSDITFYKEEIEEKNSNPYYKLQLTKSSSIKINQIREIKEFLSYKNDENEYKLVLISNAHYMTEEAQNALLKSLEEPPAGTLFVLTSSNPELLRETIKSRCWQVEFQPLNNDEILEILYNNFGVTDNSIKEIIQFAEGSIYNALDLMKYDMDKFISSTISILRNIMARRFYSSITEINELIDDDPLTFILMIKLISSWFLDVQKYRINLPIYYYVNHRETIEKFAPRFIDFDINKVITGLEEISADVEKNVNVNFLILQLVYKLQKITLPKK